MIIAGTGRMRVADEERDVSAGDLVFVPPRALHGIVNSGAGTLTYVSCATPTFSLTDFYDTRPAHSLASSGPALTRRGIALRDET